MDLTSLGAIARVEQEHWFFTARRRVIKALLKHHLRPASERQILDIGPGTGNLTDLLHPYGHVAAIEYSSDALPFYRRLASTNGNLVQGNATNLPFATGFFDAVTAFDVVEHIPDDRSAASEIHRVLNDEGTFICLVPAHPWMWSDYDEFTHHERRYTAKGFRQLLVRADFDIERMFYINTLLFAPMVAVRSWRKVVRRIRSLLGLSIDDKTHGAGLGVPPFPLNGLLREAFALEGRWAPYVNTPLGVTLVTIARKR